MLLFCCQVNGQAIGDADVPQLGNSHAKVGLDTVGSTAQPTLRMMDQTSPSPLKTKGTENNAQHVARLKQSDSKGKAEED